jgi:hypothetical protein
VRPYVYLWHDRTTRRLVASGLALEDLVPTLEKRGGLFLLDHKWGGAERHGLDFAAADELATVAKEDLYSWGDFAWADYPPPQPPTLPPESIAELLYFGHTGTPLREVAIPGLDNQFLAYGHDDGWYLALRYTAWRYVEELLAALLPEQVRAAMGTELYEGTRGFWIEGGVVEREEATDDIDGIMNRRRSATASTPHGARDDVKNA